MSRPPFVHAWLWWGLGWVGIGLLLFLSLAPIPAPPLDLPSGDKIGHALAYTVTAWWFVQLWPRPLKLGLLLVALGVLIELLQGMTGYRHADVRDALANTVGVLLGLLLGLSPAGALLAWLDPRLPPPDSRL